MVTPREKLINTNTEVKVNFLLNNSAGGNDDSCQAIVHDSELELEINDSSATKLTIDATLSGKNNHVARQGRSLMREQ